MRDEHFTCRTLAPTFAQLTKDVVFEDLWTIAILILDLVETTWLT